MDLMVSIDGGLRDDGRGGGKMKKCGQAEAELRMKQCPFNASGRTGLESPGVFSRN